MHCVREEGRLAEAGSRQSGAWLYPISQIYTCARTWLVSCVVPAVAPVDRYIASDICCMHAGCRDSRCRH